MTSDMLNVLVPAGVGAMAVLALSIMLVALGRAAQSCPEAGPPIRAASLGVAGAYAPIGLGLVLVIATSADRLLEGPTLQTGLAIVGLSLIAGGVGFAIAAATLRETATTINRRIQQSAAES